VQIYIKCNKRNNYQCLKQFLYKLSLNCRSTSVYPALQNRKFIQNPSFSQMLHVNLQICTLSFKKNSKLTAMMSKHWSRDVYIYDEETSTCWMRK